MIDIAAFKRDREQAEKIKDISQRILFWLEKKRYYKLKDLPYASTTFYKRYFERIDIEIEDLKQKKDLQEYLTGSSKHLKQLPMKLKWNGQKNALIDIFHQLKHIQGKSGQPLLPNSSDEIAQFLLNNFECFSGNSISTIRTQLDKKDNIKKSEKRIEIDCKG